MQRRRRWTVGLWAACVAGALVAACGGNDVPPERRETSLGIVVGSDDSAASGTYHWKGIPYARPPLAALRWHAPVAPEAWGLQARPAREFGAACLQIGRLFGPGANNRYDDSIATTLGTPVGSEDCLTLNIWRPASDATALPVIVFVHGGGNVSGYSADPVYDGAALAKAANAVVVTLNYRLGVLGFFNLPQLKTGADSAGDSGNFALLDILQALRLVKSDIGQFGGDAGNVTLMGQSAGAVNIWALMTAPAAAGLFHKAIPLSGGISLPSNLPPGTVATVLPAAVYQNQANALLGQLLVADGSVAEAGGAAAWVASHTAAQVADYLRGKDGRSVLAIVQAAGLNASGPVLDGTFLPTDPIAAMAGGRYQRMPVLAGNTAEEGKLFPAQLALLGGPPGYRIGDAELFNLVTHFAPDAAPSLTAADVINAAYLPVTAPGTGYNAATGLLAALSLTPARDNVLSTLATQQDKVWTYQFAWAREPAPWGDIYGAAHGFDLPFLFGNFGPSLFSRVLTGSANQPGRLGLSAAMMASVGAFVRSGDPSHGGLGASWAPWPRSLVFDATLAAPAISAR